jgi:anti-sigma factor RsiW
MIESPYLALIHAAIDGELDEHQRAELAGHLLIDPESRALRDALKHVCAALDGIAAVEPPQQLRASILAALPRVAARPQPARRAARWSAPAWRYAAVFAGALVTGTVLYEAGVGRGPDATEVAGTMAGSGARARVIVDTVRLDLGQVGGQVSLYRAAAGLGLELDLVASAPVDVLVASGDQTLRISGLGRPDSPGGSRTAVALPGVGTRGQTVDLTFLVAGRQIGAATLRIPAGR